MDLQVSPLSPPSLPPFPITTRSFPFLSLPPFVYRSSPSLPFSLSLHPSLQSLPLNNHLIPPSLPLPPSPSQHTRKRVIHPSPPLYPHQSLNSPRFCQGEGQVSNREGIKGDKKRNKGEWEERNSEIKESTRGIGKKRR